LRGRGFNKNGQMLYFTNLEAWRIEPATGGGGAAGGGAAYSAPQQQARPAQQNQNPNLRAQPSAAPIASDDDNDLPF
jgi:single-strand DNA-binding protein